MKHRQPAGLVELNRSNPLSRGLACFAFGRKEYAQGLPIYAQNGADSGWRCDRDGTYWRKPAAADSCLHIPDLNLPFTAGGYDNLTVAVVGQFSSSGVVSCAVGYNTVDSNSGWELKPEAYHNTGFIGFTHVGSPDNWDTTTAIPTPGSAPTFIACADHGQRGHLFVTDGAHSGFLGGTDRQALDDYDNRQLIIGASLRSRRYIDPLVEGDRVYLVAIWDRSLSLAELLALRRDPYQVLKPVLGRIYSFPAGSVAYPADLLETSTLSGDFGASAITLSQWDENSYAIESVLGGAVAEEVLESALSALSAYQEAAIASAGVSDTSPAENGLSGRGVASVGIIDSASATDERSGRGIAVVGVDENTPAIDFPQTSSAIPVEFSSPSTGDEIVDAVADVNAYVLEGVSAGEAWASSALALAALVSSVSAGSVLSAASSSTLSRAVVENTPASSGFVSSVVALADLVSNGDAVSALLAAVVSTTAIAESATSGSAFSAGYFEASPASVTETALPASAVSAVAVIDARFEGFSSSVSAISAVTAVSATWSSAGAAVAVFSAFDRGAARYVLASIQIRALLSASLEVSPAANVVVEINPKT